jgi:heme/copper-type cytochrome/quinol oxidase subunit 2
VVVNRERKGQTREPQKFHPREGEWGNWRGTLMILLVTGSVLGFVEYQTFASTGLYVAPKSADPLHIEVIGRQWEWIFVYPNGVKVVGNLTVPQDVEILLNVTSLDVVHSLSIPALSIAVDAVPDHNNTAWFNATQLGYLTIRCKELCGIGHALMIGTLTVTTQASYDQWYSTLQPTTGASATSAITVNSSASSPEEGSGSP